MRWTRAALETRALPCGRRSRVVLTPRRWRQALQKCLRGDGDNKARSPGRVRRKPLKPSRAGMPGDPGATVVTNACAFYHCARGCGCNGTRLSLRPLIFEGQNSRTTRARRAAGRRACVRIICVIATRWLAMTAYFVTSVIEAKVRGTLDTRFGGYDGL
jgi:hypothetical protein